MICRKNAKKLSLECKTCLFIYQKIKIILDLQIKPNLYLVKSLFRKICIYLKIRTNREKMLMEDSVFHKYT